MGLLTIDAKKYDRQLRLWGTHGQLLLEKANICLINISVIGSEILKNLILAGIGSYTLIDTQRLTTFDISTNFFYKPESIGKYCAEELVLNLQELNPLVKGYWKNENIIDLTKKDPSYLLNFDLIIITKADDELINMLSNKKYVNLPCILAESYGMVGYLKISILECPKSHPENAIPDLRIIDPFPQLSLFMESINFKTITKAQMHKLPYVVLLVKYFKEWRKLRPGIKVPLTRNEKMEFKSFFIESMAKLPSRFPGIGNGAANGSSDVSDGFNVMDASNVDEALKAINTVLGSDASAIPSRLAELFCNHKCDTSLESFWILINALKKFVSTYEKLPLRGTIPDMTADSESYLKVLEIYRTQFLLEVHTLQEFVVERMNELTLSHESSHSLVSRIVNDYKFNRDEFLLIIGKNANFISVVNGLPLNVEPQSLFDALQCQDSTAAIDPNVDQDNVPIEIEPAQIRQDLGIFYLLCRSISNIKFGRSSSQYKDVAAINGTCLKDEFMGLCSKISISNSICDHIRTEALIEEMVRFADSQIITTASFLGGIASQQIIKILTKQYVPFVGTLVYEGMNGSIVTFNQ